MLVLCAKAAFAVILIIAGGAKLADLAGFAEVLRLLIGTRWPAPAYICIATGTAFAEVLLGCASLSFPAAKWVNLLALIAGCAFVIVSVTGLALHRGRSCNCFGALSRIKFDVQGVFRSVIFAVFALLAMIGVGPSAVRLGVTTQVLLLAAGAMLISVSFAAAKALAALPEDIRRVRSR
jgi:hypothetical protein